MVAPQNGERDDVAQRESKRTDEIHRGEHTCQNLAPEQDDREDEELVRGPLGGTNASLFEVVRGKRRPVPRERITLLLELTVHVQDQQDAQEQSEDRNKLQIQVWLVAVLPASGSYGQLCV